MRGINEVTLLGHLGKDPEVRTGDGWSMCSFSLAVDETYNDKKGQEVKKVSWHNITVWGTLAVHCQNFLQKGSLILLKGKILYEEYEKDGVKKYVTKIQANDIKFLSWKEKGTESTTATAKPKAPEPDFATQVLGDDDGFPF